MVEEESTVAYHAVGAQLMREMAKKHDSLFSNFYIKFCLFMMPTQKEEVTYTDQEENRVRPTGGITSSIDNVGDESTETTAEYSFTEDYLRPEKEWGGRGKYCCIPCCRSSAYARDGQKTGLSFFKFPVGEWKRHWLQPIRRKENTKPDYFHVSTHNRICELHFRAEDIKVQFNSGKKTLKEGSEQCAFTCWPQNLQKKNAKTPRKSPHERAAARSTPLSLKKKENKVQETDTESELNMLKDDCSSCEISNKENQKLKNENFNLKLQIASLSEEVNELQSTVNLLKSQQKTT